MIRSGGSHAPGTSKHAALIVQRSLPHYRLPLFRALAESTRVDFALAYGEARADAALENAVPSPPMRVFRVRNARLGRDVVVMQRGLLQLLDSDRFDTVVTEFNPRIISNLWLLAYARRKRIRFVWWGHGMTTGAASWNLRTRLALARLADATIFYADEQARSFIAMGLSPAAVVTAPNSLDLSSIRPLCSERPLHRRDHVLFIGRLVPEKRVDVLIRAFAAAVAGLAPGANLLIIGNGPEQSPLRQLAAGLGVDTRVRFLGSLTEPGDLAPWFNASFVSVSPGPIGLSALHSLTFGLPVLFDPRAANGPEAAQLSLGRNAVAIPSGEPALIAGVLLDLRRDAARWQYLHENALRSVASDEAIARMVHGFEIAVAAAHGERPSADRAAGLGSCQ